MSTDADVSLNNVMKTFSGMKEGVAAFVRPRSARLKSMRMRFPEVVVAFLPPVQATAAPLSVVDSTYQKVAAVTAASASMIYPEALVALSVQV